MSEKTKRYWWLKLREDFFGQKAMKKLRKLAGGDTFTIIYLKMQLASLRNEGVLVFEHVEDTFEEELALSLDESVEDVQMTILYLRKNNLIEELSETEIMLPEAVKSVDSESDSAARVRNLRERRKLEALHCNAGTVTCNTEKEKEIERELEQDKTNQFIRENFEKILQC